MYIAKDQSAKTLNQARPSPGGGITRQEAWRLQNHLYYLRKLCKEEKSPRVLSPLTFAFAFHSGKRTRFCRHLAFL